MHVDDLLDGRYRLIERLARGGMATAWRAFDERLCRTVAIKQLDHRVPGDHEATTRIRTEARALARLGPPYTADVYDYGVADDGAPYLVMELIDGRPLAKVMAAEGAPPWRVAVNACAQVASALAAAHARGLVHRDVSAANVMLTTDGGRLIDFGISAVEGERDTGPDGALMGTPAYIAPERLTGQPVAPAADVYSLGVLLYLATAGRLPWPAATAQQVLLAQQLRDPEPMPPIDGLPAAVADVCMRCLSREPERRPTATEVAQVLRSAVGQGTVTTPPAGTGTPVRSELLSARTVPSIPARGCRVRRPRATRIASMAAAVTTVAVLGWLGLDRAPADAPVPSSALGATPMHHPAAPTGPACGPGTDAEKCPATDAAISAPPGPTTVPARPAATAGAAVVTAQGGGHGHGPGHGKAKGQKKKSAGTKSK
jgi:serine/threonine-protein kinase